MFFRGPELNCSLLTSDVTDRNLYNIETSVNNKQQFGFVDNIIRDVERNTDVAIYIMLFLLAVTYAWIYHNTRITFGPSNNLGPILLTRFIINPSIDRLHPL